jgi:hypothetical protein
MVVAALALAAAAAPASAERTSISGTADQVPLSAYLSPAAADALLGSWGLDDWKRARSVPDDLRFAHSCSTDLRSGDSRVLRHDEDASIRSVIGIRETRAAATRTYARLVNRVRACVLGRGEADRLVLGAKVKTDAGVARLFGLDLGKARSAHKLEYVAVAHSGQGVEVSTFHVFAQDTLPPRTLRRLAEKVVERLSKAS